MAADETDWVVIAGVTANPATETTDYVSATEVIVREDGRLDFLVDGETTAGYNSNYWAKYERRQRKED